LRTQLTSPHGDQTQRLPETWIIAMGVVRGRPLFRPRMVMSPLKPIGMRVPNRDLVIGVKIVTHHGAPAALPAALLIPSLICGLLPGIDGSGVIKLTRGKERT